MNQVQDGQNVCGLVPAESVFLAPSAELIGDDSGMGGSEGGSGFDRAPA